MRKVFTTTVSNKMTIRLKTDLDRNFSGFWAEYKAVKGISTLYFKNLLKFLKFQKFNFSNFCLIKTKEQRLKD